MMWEPIWKIVFALAGPLITLFWQRAMERRPKLIVYVLEASAHQVKSVTPNITIFTHSLVVMNAGTQAAKNVRIGHNIANFDYTLPPHTNYTATKTPNGGLEILLPVLAPREQLVISYMYAPSVTFRDIIGPVKSDEGFARTPGGLPNPASVAKGSDSRGNPCARWSRGDLIPSRPRHLVVGAPHLSARVPLPSRNGLRRGAASHATVGRSSRLAPRSRIAP